MLMAGKSHVGNVRAVNQDCFHIGEGWCIVADGMGGHKGGDTASQTAMSCIVNYLEGKEFTEAEIAAAISHANKSVHDLSLIDTNLSGMGTTVCCLFFAWGKAATANVGDSRCYRINSDGCYKITEDHSVVEELVKSGSISRAEAFSHPQKNIITRVVGTNASVEVDIHWHDIYPGDRFLLCSDGLTDMLTEEEIFQIVRNNDINEGVDKLIERALESGGSDNITVILVDKENQ